MYLTSLYYGSAASAAAVGRVYLGTHRRPHPIEAGPRSSVDRVVYACLSSVRARHPIFALLVAIPSGASIATCFATQIALHLLEAHCLVQRTRSEITAYIPRLSLAQDDGYNRPESAIYCALALG